MKKDFPVQLIHKINLILVTMVIVAVCFPIGANATELEQGKSYQIILRAGEHGNFNIASSESPNIYNSKKLAFNVEPGSDLNVQVESGQVFIEDQLLCNIDIDPDYAGKYFVMDYKNGYTQISRNQEYVIDYGRLVDAVEYKVEYLDNATGIQVAEPTLGYRNHGDAFNVSAKSISNYALANNSPQLLTLDKDAAENKIIFRYNSTLTGGTTTNTTYQTVDGGTQTINETQQNPIYQAVPGAAPASAVAATGGGGGGGADTTAIEDEETALEAEPAEPEGEAQESAEATEETGEATEEATIEEEEVPLAASQQPFNLAAVLAILLGGVALILATVWIIARRRTIDVDDVDQSDEEHKQ